MATADEIVAARNRLQQRQEAEAVLRRQFEQLDERLRNLRATIVVPNRNQQISQLDTQVKQALQAYANAQADTATAQRQLNALLQSAPAAEPPVASAGQVVAEEARARSNGAVAQNPSDTATVTIVQTTPVTPTAQDSGLDSRTRPLSQTQAVPAPNINTGRASVAALVEGGLDPQQALNVAAGGTAIQSGVGARNEDGATVTGNSTKNIINDTFGSASNQLIVPQPNVLDDYASYTYQISWYLLTPQQYNNLIFSSNFNIGTWTLLVQSGGAPLPPVSATGAPSAVGGRSALFPLDYYIDDLNLLSKLPNKGTGMPHNTVDIKFRVTEPNGITLIDNLYAAVDNLRRSQQPTAFVNDGTVPDYNAQDQRVQAQGGTRPNYINQQYCLGIKFYGYDSGGNLVAPATGRRINPGGANTGPSNDVYAVIEKYYPFILQDIKFRVASRLVEYEITAKPVNLTALDQARGTVPFNFELSGATVKDLLIGKAAQSARQLRSDGRQPQSQPAKVGPAPAPVLEQQRELLGGEFVPGSSTYGA